MTKVQHPQCKIQFIECNEPSRAKLTTPAYFHPPSLFVKEKAATSHQQPDYDLLETFFCKRKRY